MEKGNIKLEILLEAQFQSQTLGTGDELANLLIQKYQISSAETEQYLRIISKEASEGQKDESKIKEFIKEMIEELGIKQNPLIMKLVADKYDLPLMDAMNMVNEQCAASGNGSVPNNPMAEKPKNTVPTGSDLNPEIFQVALNGILKARPKLEVINDMTVNSDMSIMRANEYYEAAFGSLFSDITDAEAVINQIRKMHFEESKSDVEIMDFLKTEKYLDAVKAKICLDAVKSKFGTRKSYKVNPEYYQMNSEAVQYARKMYFKDHLTDEILILNSLQSIYGLSVMDGKKVFDAMIEKYGNGAVSETASISNNAETKSNRKPGGALILIGAIFLAVHYFMHWEGKFMLFLGCALIVVGLLAKFGKK